MRQTTPHTARHRTTTTSRRCLFACLAAVPLVPVVFAQHFRTSVTESGELALRKGWLEKRSTGKFRRFQRRWFVLQGHYLKYFQVHRCGSRQAAWPESRVCASLQLACMHR